MGGFGDQPSPQALQTHEQHKIATPAEWRPGEKVIVPAPMTQEGAEKRVGETGLEQKDWYFSKKDV